MRSVREFRARFGRRTCCRGPSTARAIGLANVPLRSGWQRRDEGKSRLQPRVKIRGISPRDAPCYKKVAFSGYSEVICIRSL
jgi:hypothetical protein